MLFCMAQTLLLCLPMRLSCVSPQTLPWVEGSRCMLSLGTVIGQCRAWPLSSTWDIFEGQLWIKSLPD